MFRTNGKLLLKIFWTFLLISPATFGGGYAMLPLIEREVVRNRQWVNGKDMDDIFAVAGSVPGAIAINSATIIGYRLAGVLGAIFATIGVLLPTFLIALSLSILFLHIQHHPVVEAAFVSIRATIVALIAYAAYKFGKSAVVDKTSFALIVLAVTLLYFAQVHPVWIILGGIVAGIVLVDMKRRLGGAKKEQAEEDKERSPDYFMGDGI